MIEQLSSTVVRATLGDPVSARRGTMLGYHGEVAITPTIGMESLGSSGFLRSAAAVAAHAAAGEHNPVMTCAGSGTVLFGLNGLAVQIISLQDDALQVEASRLLVYDTSLQASVVSLGGSALRGMATGQGLFTTRLSGTGDVAVLAHGALMTLPATPTLRVDPQAYIGHTGRDVQVSLKQQIGMRDLIGRGSGEALQLAFAGDGVVLVQASEQKL